MARPDDPNYEPTFEARQLAYGTLRDFMWSVYCLSPFLRFDEPGLWFEWGYGDRIGRHRVVPISKRVQGHREEIVMSAKVASVFVWCIGWVLAAVWLGGCYIGPMGFMLGSAAYEHVELDEPVELGIHPETGQALASETIEGNQPSASQWRTRIARTWGTSMIEGMADMQQERFSFGSKGISTNMRKVIGDDSLEKAIQAIMAGINPAGGGAALLLDGLKERDAERSSEADDVDDGGGFLSLPDF